MGRVELWLGPAGAGKTREALAVLREALDRHWWAIRYLVPTVGHKRSIEQLVLEHSQRAGLFGDPVNIFFTFAQEVARRGGVHGNPLSELQKHLILKELVRATPLDYFARAAQFPGFVQALGEAIDELKVHMIQSEELLQAAKVAGERGAGIFAQKIFELGTLYGRYQQRVINENLYDNEGIMWLAAECLREQPHLFADELDCLILDGFARLTPIQLYFLRALSPRATRTILLFDYEESRSETYHPVQSSLDHLARLEEAEGLNLTRRVFERHEARTTLEQLRSEVFRDRKHSYPCDDSIAMFVGATPAHEAELIARDVRALLREGTLPDGTRITPADIAILARSGERLRERMAQVFARYGLSIRRDPPLLAHTSVGRALLAAFRLVRDRWKREDVLTLLKSGFLPIDPALAFQIDITARTNYLRDRKSTWFERWPDDETRDSLVAALAPLAAFDEAFQHRDRIDFLDAIGELLSVYRRQALDDMPPLPDVDEQAAARYVALKSAFSRTETMLDDLRQLRELSGTYQPEEMLDVVTTALLRETVPHAVTPSEGIPVLPVHATGGEKFKVVYLCDLLQGVFPRHQRESAFLMDHEREETLRDLQVLIETRKHLEDDEQHWFLHALSSATHRIVLSYASNDLDGRPLEHSAFIDEVVKVLPSLPERARRTSFRDIVPSLEGAESREEFQAALAYRLRTERDDDQRAVLAAAYAGCSPEHRLISMLFGRAQAPDAMLVSEEARCHMSDGNRVHSASELQGYLDCPFLWFAGYCLNVQSVVEEFSPLDRGVILHSVLEQLYRCRQRHPKEPVHLEDYRFEELWTEVEVDLRARLDGEPRFANRAKFLQDIEWESLCRMMRRFLHNEMARARTRRAHPAFFEHRFGGRDGALALGDGSVRLRGTLDRIDLADDDPTRAVVIDYKSSASMTQKDIRGGKIVQAPIYLLALQRLLGIQPLGAEFVGLKRGDTKGIYRQGIADLYDDLSGVKELEPGEWESYLEACEERLCEAARAMGQGLIASAPTTTRCPDSCEYFALCRGDRFTLARLVRQRGTGTVQSPDS